MSVTPLDGLSPTASAERTAPGSPRLLRMIALFKFVKAVLFVVVAAGAFELLRADLAARAQAWVVELSASYDDPLVQRALDLLAQLTGLGRHRLQLVGAAAVAYAILFVTEGVGLWRGRRWAEYLTTIATSSLIPLEAYEVVRRTSVLRVAVLVVNVAVVVYFVRQLRAHPRHRGAPRR